MEVNSAETFSYRLREPLHSIIGFVKLILDGMVPSPEMQQEVLAIVYQQSEKLRTIIDELLESGIVKPMGMENPPIPIKEIVQEAVRRNKKFAAENEIGLKTEFSRELSNIRGDSHKIGHALEILIAHTIKISPPGGYIVISASEEGNYVTVQISATGTGIPGNAIPEMLPEAIKDDTSNNLAGAGNNLDLYIARKYIEAHCGELCVDIVEGRGTFIVKLLIRECCEFISAGNVFDSLLSNLKLDTTHPASNAASDGSARKQVLRPVNLEDNSLTIRFDEGYLTDLLAISSNIGVSPSVLARQIIENAIIRYTQKDTQKSELSSITSSPAHEFSALKPKELELLRYLAQGMSNKEIAYSMGLKVGTVKNRITMILHKLEASSRTHAATLAMKHNLI